MAKSLYIGNLPYTTSESQLKDLFSQAGTVESVTVIIDRSTGQGKGFAFVEMAAEQDSQKAIEMFKGYKMGDRSIIVNEARPQEGGGRGYKRDDRSDRSRSRPRY